MGAVRTGSVRMTHCVSSATPFNLKSRAGDDESVDRPAKSSPHTAAGDRNRRRTAGDRRLSARHRANAAPAVTLEAIRRADDRASFCCSIFIRFLATRWLCACYARSCTDSTKLKRCGRGAEAMLGGGLSEAIRLACCETDLKDQCCDSLSSTTSAAANAPSSLHTDRASLWQHRFRSGSFTRPASKTVTRSTR